MKNAKMSAILVLTLGLMVCFAQFSQAAPMGTAFTYQGRLLDANSPAEGIYDAIFVLYDLPEGPNELGVTEIQNFEAFDGYFTVELDFGSNAFDGSERWLEVYIRPGDFNDPCGHTILWPRQKITPTPYALYAKHAEVEAPLHLEGSSADAIILGMNDGSGYGIGGISNNGIGIRGQSTSGTGVVGDNVAGNYGKLGTPNYGVHGVGTTAIFGESTTGVGIKGHSDVGDGVVGWTGNLNKSGVFGYSSQGFGVTGRSDDNYGVYGKNVASGNYGYLGDPNYGVYGKNVASGNYGYLGSYDVGVYGHSSSDIGVYGKNVASGNYGYLGTSFYGVYGWSPIGYGVYGASTSGNGVSGLSATGYGVYGKNFENDHYGVLGTKGNGVLGVSNTVTGTGVFGFATTAGYGVYGKSDSNGYAGYFEGSVQIEGTLIKGSGSFKIDHPLDPENKYLSHSFVESPDMMNVYNGNAVLDKNGEAAVKLPEYFEALNRDFRYQLTAIGAPGPNLYIAEEISENRFKIAGGKKGTKVSWQVTGVRHDPHAVAHRVQVEEEKKDEERGYYLHPTAYGLPEEKGIGSVRNPQLSEIHQVAKKAN
jgi:hypothetical protein